MLQLYVELWQTDSFCILMYSNVKMKIVKAA